MTKEEQKAVEEFTEMNLTKKGLYHYNDMQDAFLIGLFKGENMQPSLPSNLDEAAKEYLRQYNECESGNGGDDWDDDICITFKASAEWIARPRWISVDERLPEMDDEVIVLSDELGTAPIYKISFGHIVDVNRCIDYNGWNIPGVKYWMPCPKIPGMND